MKTPAFLLPLLLLSACTPTTTPATSEVPPPPPLPSEKASPEPTALAPSADPAPADAPPPEGGKALSLPEASNAFGLHLYTHLRQSPGNLAMSPASITLALTMTWAGARGETAAQMARVLHLGGEQKALLEDAKGLISTWNDPNRKTYTLKIANRLFGEKSYSFEKAYLQTTGDMFGAPLEPTNFKGAAEAGRKHINGWVEKQTQDRIKNLIPQGSIDADTRLVLVNAIYFLGNWETPFTKAATRPAPFYLTPEKPKDVPTMHQTGGFKYAETDGLKLLEMPYEGGELAMVLALPDAKDGLSTLEDKLDSDKLASWIGSMTTRRVIVSLPSFTIDPQNSLSLGDALKGMGMELAFDRGKADFTGIANPSNAADRLFIGKVFHKAFVKVDEKGTEAAASTAVIMPRIGSAARPERMPEFRADHPFLFFLRDTRSGAILFMGRVSDPTAS